MVMPRLEGLEALALGTATRESFVFREDQAEAWKADFPYVYHVSRQEVFSKEA